MLIFNIFKCGLKGTLSSERLFGIFNIIYKRHFDKNKSSSYYSKCEKTLFNDSARVGCVNIPS